VLQLLLVMRTMKNDGNKSRFEWMSAMIQMMEGDDEEIHFVGNLCGLSDRINSSGRR